jgi:aminoglycoside 3-N-acetyltransferase
MNEHKVGEHRVVEATKIQPSPVTVASLRRDLTALGVEPGMVLLVHSSLSSLGWVCGKSVAVIEALESVLTPDGTLVMPTHSGELSEPSYWRDPPVPEAWWQTIRDTMPAFQPDLTPTRGMGLIPETFRKQEGVLRSHHPQVSFAAWGRYAKQITEDHGLAFSLGETSPLARLYDLNAHILLLGVGHGNNTSLHLAEYRANYPDKKVIQQGAPILLKGKRLWQTFEDTETDDDDFETIGKAFAEEGGLEHVGKIGQADAKLLPQKELVDFAVQWMEMNRK